MALSSLCGEGSPETVEMSEEETLQRQIVCDFESPCKRVRRKPCTSKLFATLNHLVEEWEETLHKQIVNDFEPPCKRLGGNPAKVN